MYFVSDVDNQDTLREIVLDTCEGLNKKWANINHYGIM
jgi:hypothetical protein